MSKTYDVVYYQAHQYAVKNPQGASREQQSLTWDDFLNQHVYHELDVIPEKDNQGVLLPGLVIGDGRSDQNVKHVSMFFGDIDKNATHEDIDRLYDLLFERGINAAIHLTHSSYDLSRTEPDAVKARFILPLSEPVPGNKWREFYYKAQAYFSFLTLDMKCANPSHVFFKLAAPSAEAKDWLTQAVGQDIERGRRAVHDANPLDIASIWGQTTKGTVVSIPANLTKIWNAPAVVIEDAYKALVKKHKGSTDQWKATCAEAIRLLLKGDVFSEPDTREDILQSVCGMIASRCPTIPAESLAQVWVPSLAYMAHQHPNDPPPTLERITKAIASFQAKEVKRQAEQVEEQQSRLYTDEQIAMLQARDCIPIEDFGRTWILGTKSGKRYFLRTLKGWEDCEASDMSQAVNNPLLVPAGIEVYKTVGPKGAERVLVRPIHELMDQYGTLLKELRYDMTATNTTYDHAERRLIVEVPRRHMEPAYHPEIHGYLESWGNTAEQRRKFIDWCASFLHLDRPLCSLYMVSAPRQGKEFLFSAFRFPWFDKDVRLNELGKQFNPYLKVTPIIVADEGFRSMKQKEASDWLRESVTSKFRDVEEKFGGVSQVHGYRRVMMSMNDYSLLSFNGAKLNEDSKRALNERILLVECTDEAPRRYLEAMQAKYGQNITFDWISSGAFLAHLEWLAIQENHAVTRAGRLWVEGDVSSMYKLLTHSGDTADLGFFLVAAILKAHKQGKGSRVDGFDCRPVNDQPHVWIASKFLTDNWEDLAKSRDIPRSPGRLLSSVSPGRSEHQRGVKGYEINMDWFIEYVKESWGDQLEVIVDFLMRNKSQPIASEFKPN